MEFFYLFIYVAKGKVGADRFCLRNMLLSLHRFTIARISPVATAMQFSPLAFRVSTFFGSQSHMKMSRSLSFVDFVGQTQAVRLYVGGILRAGEEYQCLMTLAKSTRSRLSCVARVVPRHLHTLCCACSAASVSPSMLYSGGRVTRAPRRGH